jgi:hypothetical protein
VTVQASNPIATHLVLPVCLRWVIHDPLVAEANVEKLAVVVPGRIHIAMDSHVPVPLEDLMRGTRGNSLSLSCSPRNQVPGPVWKRGGT